MKPGRDPRDELPPPLMTEDIMEMEDLKPGMVLNGTVRNGGFLSLRGYRGSPGRIGSYLRAV